MSPACDHDDCVCQPLPTVKRGQWMIVRHVLGKAGDRQRLQEMGFREQAEVKIVCSGGSIIAQVQGAKICLSRSMAQSIMVATH